MLRHFQLFAPAPGREAEVERALLRWLEEVAAAVEFRGGAVLREYAGEFGDVEGASAVLYDVESLEAGMASRQATVHVSSPMTQDIRGDEPADQGAVLFEPGRQHSREGHGGEQHPQDDHAHKAPLSGRRYDRCGGTLARLFHGHFTIVASQSSTGIIVPAGQ